MGVAKEVKARLTADDWADEALRMLPERGLAGIAVEPIALRLGATKGSFYWHFANRDALIDAALARWERQHTEVVIAGVDREPDPRARLRRLFAEVIVKGGRNRVELALLASVDDPRVAPVLRRVTAQRLDYLTEVLRAAGFAEPEARRRAQLAYTAYLGHVQLAHTDPEHTIDDAAYRDLVIAALLS